MFHLCQSLLQTGKNGGIDDINSYYDIKLKEKKLINLKFNLKN